MNQQIQDSFEILSFLRKKFLNLIEGHSLEELNRVPAGYHNNLIWNIIHCLVSTDILVYSPAGLDLPLAKWAEGYRKGTKPDPSSPVTPEMLEEVKLELTSSHQRLIEDYRQEIFKKYESYQTQFGVTLKSVEYAILYAVDHEMLHLGYTMSQKKALTSQ